MTQSGAQTGSQIRRRRVVGLGLAAAVAIAVHGAETGTAGAQGGATIAGRVVDEDGAPVAGAAVTIASTYLPAGEESLETDGAGAFRLADLPAGLYDVFVEIGPRHAELRDVRVADGGTARVEIVLGKPGASNGGY